MRKFLISIICALCACSAFAAGENVATSKAFVDTAVAQKQDKIPANDGTAAVLTNTGTAGNVGTKNIYDSFAPYADQTDSLIDAQTMNAGVQNAIDTEFECISWVDDDPTKDCLLVEILPQKNLFMGPYFGGINMGIAFRYNPVVTISSPYTPRSGSFSGPVFVANVQPGKKYYMTGTTDATYVFYAFYASENDATHGASSINNVIAHYMGHNKEITVPDGATYLVLSYSNADNTPITWSGVHLKKLSTTYLPSGN